MNENVRNCSQIILGSGEGGGHKRNISRTMSVENENPIEELPTGEMEEETSGFLDEENSGIGHEKIFKCIEKYCKILMKLYWKTDRLSSGKMGFSPV